MSDYVNIAFKAVEEKNLKRRGAQWLGQMHAVKRPRVQNVFDQFALNVARW